MRRHRSWMALGWMASSRPLISSACRLPSPCDKIKPEFEQNRQSMQTYQLTLIIADAAGPFASPASRAHRRSRPKDSTCNDTFRGQA